MKVLHIDTERGWRGGQQQVFYLHEGLYRRGFPTLLVCLPDSALEKSCKEKGLPVRTLSMHSEADIIAGFRVASLARKKGVSILHLHSAHALAIGLWAKLFYPSVKLIAVRRVDFHIRKNPFSRYKYKSSKLDRIVCISEGIKRILLEDGIPESGLVVIHDGIDLRRFEDIKTYADMREVLGIPQNHVVIGTIAALVGHKDYPTLLQAARLVLDRFREVTFLAVGDGDQAKTLNILAKELALGDSFRFLGFRRDVGHLLKTFDIFVLASREEGLGTSLLDAQAVGLPVVGTDAGGIPEAIRDGLNGLLVPRENPQELAGALMRLIQNPDLRTELGKKAQESVRRFSIENTLDKTIRLYEDLA